MVAFALVAAMAAGRAAHAEEGLWTPGNFPRGEVQARHGFAPDDAWMSRVQESTVIMGRCSGTLVSPSGLVLVARECVTSCLEVQAAVRRSRALFGEACRDKALRRALPLFDLLYCAPLDRQEARQAGRAAFVARTPADELPCTNRAVRQLLSIQDVTPRIKQAAERAASEGRGRLEAELAEVGKIRKECGGSDRLECQVVPFYDGARFELHRWRHHRDVRLVFAPEEAVASFGVEISPLAFPQHRFTAALVRVYDDGGKPAVTPSLPLAAVPPREGELVFLAGHPPSTGRRASVASFQHTRDEQGWVLPFSTEIRGTLHQYALHKAGPARAAEVIRSLDTQVANTRSLHDALGPGLLARVAERERILRARIDQDPKLRQLYAGAWEEQQRVAAELLPAQRRLVLVENAGCGSLYQTSLSLVRAAYERGKPDGKRLAPFTSQRLPQTEREVLRPMTFEEGVETEVMAFCLRVLREQLGPAHPIIQKMLAGHSPDEAARQMIRKTRLPDLSARRALWQGGRAAVEASTDPFIVMWRTIDADLRAARKTFTERVEKPLARAERRIGDARFAVFGTSEYPDGNGTLRIRWGEIAAPIAEGNPVPALVPLGATFAAATGKPPFELPARWLEARPRLDPAIPLVFTATTDMVVGPGLRTDDVGGPLLNRDLQVVGMTQGGNQAVAGSLFDHDKAASRTVGLTGAAILHVLERVYGADRLVSELRAASPPPAGRR